MEIFNYPKARVTEWFRVGQLQSCRVEKEIGISQWSAFSLHKDRGQANPKIYLKKLLLAI